MRRFHESETRIGGEEDNEIADVDHAARIVERLVIDGQAGMAGVAKAVEHLAQGRVERERDDVRARHHHVLDPDFVQRQHVLEDGALLGRELLARALLDRVFDIVAGRGRLQAEQGPHALKQARRLFAGNAGRRLRRRLPVVRHGHPPATARA